jgi:hypothetical protein
MAQPNFISLDDFNRRYAGGSGRTPEAPAAAGGFLSLDAFNQRYASQPAPVDPQNQPVVGDRADYSMGTEAGFTIPEPAPDPELAQFYQDTTRGQRITNPLRAGGLQVRQGAQVLGADVAARQSDTFNRARSTQPGQPGAPMGGMVRAMREQTPQQAAQTEQTLGDLLSRSVQGATERGKQISEIPANPAFSGMMQAKSWGEAAEQFWRDPFGVLQAVTFQSLPQAAPAIGAAMLTGPAGGAAVAGGSGFLSEYAQTILEELGRAGVDIGNVDALRTAFQTPELMATVREKARLRGGIVGGTEAASMGIAGRTLAPRMESQFARQLVNVPAQAGAQGTLAGTGEAGAQVALHGQVDQPGPIIAEIIGEAGTAPADVAGIAAGRYGRKAFHNGSYVGELPRERVEPTLTIPPPSVRPNDTVTSFPAPDRESGAASPQGGATPPQPVPGTPLTPAPAGGGVDSTAPNIVVTPRGRRVEVAPEIIEAADLVTSHTDDMVANAAFPAELQPRDRERAASAAQVTDIAANLQPELLGLTGSATEGAPIIGPGRVVESGNARTLAIARAYNQGLPGAEAYRSWLMRQGFDVSGFKQPVLVRRRLSQLEPGDRQSFTREANERSTLSMGTAEQAASDAKALSPGVMSFLQPGELTNVGNTGFVRRFIQALAPAERGAMIDANGQITQDGLRRIEAALFVRAYGDPGILASLREQQDTNIKGIGDALTRVAGEIARLRDAIERGQLRRELDAAKPLVEAARLVQQARSKGTKISDAANQVDMFSGGPSPATKAALRLFFRDDGLTRPRASKDIADALRFYVDQAQRNQAGPGLSPVQQQVMAADLFDLARQRADGGLLSDVAESRTPSTGGRFVPLAEFQERYANRPAQAGTADTLPDTAESRQNMTPGANYVGAVPDRLNAGVRAKGKEPIRRERVLAKLFGDLEAALYEGRIKGKSTLGFYRRTIEEVRTKRANDLETAAHEIAHMLDDRFPELRRMWTPASNANKAVRAELAGVSYDKTKLYEGFAEFVRLYMTQEPQAQARAPQFHSLFEDWLANKAPQEVRRAVMAAKLEMHDWFAQDALDRARSKIGDAGIDVNAAQETVWSRLRQSTLDDLEGIRRMERELTGDLPLDGAYATARLTRGVTEIINGALTLGGIKVRPNGSHTYEGKSLADILGPIKNKIRDAEMYFVGRAAAELKGQGRENLFSSAEINAMLRLETPEFKKAFAEYQDWNKGVLDFAQAKGIINPIARQFWQRTSYLPFHRVGSGAPAGREAVSGLFSGIKELKGGTSNIRDPLQNMIANAGMLIHAAVMNDARKEVARLAQMQGGARFMAKIPTEERSVKIHQDEVKRAVLEVLKGQLPPDAIDDVRDALDANIGPFEFLMRGQTPAGGNVVAVLTGGKPDYYEVASPLLYRALEALDRKPAGNLMRFIGGARRLGQTGVTLTPDFAVRNFFRDQLMAGIMSRHGYRPFYDGVRGFVSRLRQDRHYRDFVANGGGLSSHMMDEEGMRAHLDRFYAKYGINANTVLNSPRKLKYALDRLTESLESATRIGEYRRARERGASAPAAAYSGREVSTDFAMRGDAKDAIMRGDAATVAFLRDTVMFLSASVNGMERFYRGVAHDPNRWKIMGTTAALALASSALYLVNAGRPEYEDLEDWDRDMHWHLWVPDGQGGEHHFRLPKLWEVGAVSSLAERTMEAWRTGGDEDTAKKLFNVVLGAFHLDVVPQIINPAVEVWGNRDRFRNAPIEPEGVEDLQPWARSTARTSATTQALGEATRELPRGMQISPAQAQHLLEGYLSTWGTYLLDLSDWRFFDDVKADKRLDQMPVVKSFYRQDDPAGSSRHVREFYDAYRASQEVRNTMRLMDRRGNDEAADDLANDPANLMHRQLSRANRTMGGLNREVAAVNAARTLPDLQQLALDRAELTGNRTLVGNAQMRRQWDDMGALKRILLDDITRERNAFAKDVSQDVKAQRREMRATGSQQ